MMKKTPKTRPSCFTFGAVAFLAGSVLAGCDSAAGVTAENAVITLPALRNQPGAAYFRLHADAADRLVRVESDAAERVELHETRTTATGTTMAPLQQATFDAQGDLVFAPGGKHAMLFGVKPGLAPGARAKITFVFETAPPVTVDAEVRGPGQGHSGH